VLSPDLQKLVADAIQNGTPPVLTSTAFVLEKAGFQSAADELKRRAKDAAASVPPPPVQDHPNAALDPTMPADLALQVARQLQLQGDPGALDTLATELRNRGFNTTADQVQAKAQQIRTMLDAARTMHDIDTEFKSPGIVAPSPGALPTSAAPFPSPAAPTATFPLTVTATPAAPVPVPSSPQPQAPAPEKSKAQILAEALSSSLNDLIQRYGSVPKARFKEDKGLVTRFQSQEGLTTDGNYGPTTAEHVGRYVANVPPPFYWKKGAGQKDLST
jgi:murein L,D-transpeptidase YcbB/YkuD